MNLVSIGNGFQLDRPAAVAYLRMAEAAKADGIVFHINTAYRSRDYQTRLYNQYLADKKAGKNPTPVAKPGNSKHEIGLALDISVASYPATLKWLRANAKRFGFFEAVGKEPWHWVYEV